MDIESFFNKLGYKSSMNWSLERMGNSQDVSITKSVV